MVAGAAVVAAGRGKGRRARHPQAEKRPHAMLSRQPDQYGSRWQSVIDYFPEKEYFTLRAEQQLALIYLRKGEWIGHVGL